MVLRSRTLLRVGGQIIATTNTKLATMRLSLISSKLAHWGVTALGLGGMLLMTGCKLNFWQMDGHQTTMVTAGPVAKSQLDVFYVTCWVTLVIFLLVGAVLAYATIKFKARNEADANAEPPAQSHGNPLIEISLIGASILALVIISVPTLKAIWFTYDVPEAEKENVYEITATGYQWWFKFSYPEQIDGVGSLTTANELVIPAGRPVRVQLRTTDVIHSFWVPKLAGKVDMIPNRGNHLWMQADEPGYFWGQCAEFCGESHAVMRFRVIALNEQDFADWVTNQKLPARTVEAAQIASSSDAPVVEFASYKRNAYGFTDKWDAKADISPIDNWKQMQFPEKDESTALIAEGRKIFQAKTCVICHTVSGHEGVGTNGPTLTHVGSRTTIAGGLLENNSEQLARWLKHPDQVKPGNKMYFGINGMAGYMKPEDGQWVPNIELSHDDVTALVSYLQSLK